MVCFVLGTTFGVAKVIWGNLKKLTVVGWAWAGVMLILISGNVTAQQQLKRGDLRTPGLVVETGFPTAQTRALFFSADSQTLFAAGLDKVVREWQLVNGVADRRSLKTYRWAIYREQRGCIYCAALSHDAEQRFLAVAGFGLRNGAVAILDRESGQVVYSLMQPQSGANVISMAFASDTDSLLIGRSDGTVALWNYQQSGNDLVEATSRSQEESPNPVLAIAEPYPGRFISVAASGAAVQWDFRQGNAKRTRLAPFDMKEVYLAKLSGDNRFCAVMGYTGNHQAVKIRDLRQAGQADISLNFPATAKVSALAFSNDGDFLFVALEYNNGRYELQRFGRDNRGTYRVRQTISVTHKVELLTVSPSDEALVLANNRDELHLMDIRRGTWTDQLSGPGEHVEQVAFSNDGTQFAFRSGDKTAWRVFDLQTQDWAKHDATTRFQPAPNSSQTNRWEIVEDDKDLRIRHIVDKQTGRKHLIPTIPTIDLIPTCHLFLEPTVGGQEIRFLIGHQWGASLFELQPGQNVRLLRRFVGHQSEVLCMGVSPDQTRLISGSRDRTISVWSLTPWPYQEELGADFELRNDRLYVNHVAEGSPAWEAKLQPGDEIVQFAYDGRWQETSPQHWNSILQSPVPGKELVFRVNGGETLTTTRQRPLWRFFASQDHEWILWRWRDYYYDCSTYGDLLIGWQINGDVDETPFFTTAEQSRQRFCRPDLVAEMLAPSPRPIAVERIEEAELISPHMELNIVADADGQGWNITVSVPDSSQNQSETVPHEVWLWLNDQKIRSWKDTNFPFSETFSIADNQLRAGENHFLAQAYSQNFIRGDSKTESIVSHKQIPDNAEQHRLFGLCIGVNNYRGAKDFDGSAITNLPYCKEDAQTLRDVLHTQQQLGAFRQSDIRMLGDEDVSKKRITEILTDVAKQASPDDVFVLFLAGHGWAKQISYRPTKVDPTTFVFVTPNFDVRNPDETGLSFFQKPRSADDSSGDTLYELLVNIPCHKIVLLDCCHSGSIGKSTDMIRCLTPELVGPVIFTACDQHEESYPSRKNQHGVFTTAIFEALRERSVADGTTRRDRVTTREIADWTQKRVPQILKEESPVLRQNPQFYFPEVTPSHILFGLHKEEK